MLEFFQLPFMQYALCAGMMIGLLTGFYGVFIVQRRLSFLGNGLAYATFGGISLGILLQVEPLWIAFPFTIFVAIAILWIQHKTVLTGDTAIGIFFALSMAFGIIFISLANSYSVDAFNYLFGSILAVSITDLLAIGLLLVLSLSALPLWKYWAYSTFDRELALTDGVQVHKTDVILFIFIATTIVVATKILGVVLVASYLVIPAATARLLSQSFSQMTIFSMWIGVMTTIIGMTISYMIDMPSGAIIVLVQSSFFFLSMVKEKV